MIRKQSSDTLARTRGVLVISRADLTGHFGGRKMDESKVTIGDRKSRNSAIAMVVLMLLSSQMYILMDFER